jgi:hypothetical protein
MTSQTWYEPPDGITPVVGDKIRTTAGRMTVIEILDQRGPRYLLRLQGDDPQPCS